MLTMLTGQLLTILISSFCALIGVLIFGIGFIGKHSNIKIIGGVFALFGLASLFVNDEEFRDIITGAAIVIAAVIAAIALQQNTSLRKDAIDREKRDRKEHQLDEIIEWGNDIQKCGLDIPIIPGATTIDIQKSILLRYGIPFSKNNSIKAMAMSSFDDKYATLVEDGINVFVIFLFLKSMSFGKDITDNFRGTYLKVIEDFKKEHFAGKEKGVEELLTEYNIKLANAIDSILVEANIIKANLQV